MSQSNSETPENETPEEDRDAGDTVQPWVERPDGSYCHPSLLRIGLGRLGPRRR